MELHCLIGINSWHLNWRPVGNGRVILLVLLMLFLFSLFALFIAIGYDLIICDRVLISIAMLALEKLDVLPNLYDRLLGALLA